MMAVAAVGISEQDVNEGREYHSHKNFMGKIH